MQLLPMRRNDEIIQHELLEEGVGRLEGLEQEWQLEGKSVDAQVSKLFILQQMGEGLREIALYLGVIIDGQTDRRVTLVTEYPDGTTVLVTSLSGVENLEKCWSISPNNQYTLESAEILEKCLLWNYQNALESWRAV